jgi:hypothetical protein
MFNSFDPNGNGYLSLAEVDLGIKSILRADDLFDAKPVIIRAFNAAKNKSGNQRGSAADYVTFSEFRTLLWYLRQYFEYWIMFNRIDTSDDRRLSFTEFGQALDEIAAWGVHVDDVEAAFNEIDSDGHGMILFDEFSNWAIAKHLDLEDDDEHEEGAVELKVQEKYDASRNIAREHEQNRAKRSPKSSARTPKSNRKKSKDKSPKAKTKASPLRRPMPKKLTTAPSPTNPPRQQPDSTWSKLSQRLPWQKNTGGQETSQANVQFL